MKRNTGESQTPSRKPPLYVLLVFILVSGFSAGGAGMRILARNAAAASNPFAVFADVFPGQSRSAVAARGFSCYSAGASASDRDPTDESCILRPESGSLSQVEVLIPGDEIRRLDFRIHENALRLGDLAVFWGVPEVQRYSRSLYVFWRSLGIFALVVRNTEEFSLFLPVQRVYFFSH